MEGTDTELGLERSKGWTDGVGAGHLGGLRRDKPECRRLPTARGQSEQNDGQTRRGAQARAEAPLSPQAQASRGRVSLSLCQRTCEAGAAFAFPPASGVDVPPSGCYLLSSALPQSHHYHQLRGVRGHCGPRSHVACTVMASVRHAHWAPASPQLLALPETGVLGLVWASACSGLC